MGSFGKISPELGEIVFCGFFVILILTVPAFFQDSFAVNFPSMSIGWMPKIFPEVIVISFSPFALKMKSGGFGGMERQIE